MVTFWSSVTFSWNCCNIALLITKPILSNPHIFQNSMNSKMWITLKHEKTIKMIAKNIQIFCTHRKISFFFYKLFTLHLNRLKTCKNLLHNLFYLLYFWLRKCNRKAQVFDLKNSSVVFLGRFQKLYKEWNKWQEFLHGWLFMIPFIFTLIFAWVYAMYLFPW